MQTQNTKHKTWPLFILSSCIAMCISAILLYACKKETSSKENTISYHIPHQSEKDVKNGARVYSSPQYYQLQVNSVGQCRLNLITENCFSGTTTITQITGGHSDNIIGSSYSPPTYLTGLALDARTGKFYATDGGHHLVKFYLSDVNDASYAPITLTNSTGDPLHLCDIERDPQTGYYFAINRTPASPYVCRIVIIDTFFNVTYLPIATTNYQNLDCRGLCFYNNGVVVMERTNNNYEYINKTNGYYINGCGGFGTYGSAGDYEIGLHGDPITNTVIMANQKPGTTPGTVNFMSFDGNTVSCPPNFCPSPMILFPYAGCGLYPANTVDFCSTVNDDW